MISAGITFFLSVFSASRLKVYGQPVFGLWMLICSCWSVCNAFELMGTALQVKLFWANMQYGAYTLFPVCLFVLIAQLTGIWQKIELRSVVFMLIIPVVTTVLVWFDTRFGLVRYGFSLDTSGAIPVIKKTYGPWFYIHALYTYSLFFAALFVLVRSMLHQHNSLYRKQQRLLLLSVLAVFIPNIMYVTGISPVKAFDVTPVFFCVTGLLVLISMVRYRFLNLVPVAREAVFENMGEAVIVTAEDGRILDGNSRVLLLGKCSRSQASDRFVKDVLPQFFPAAVPDHEGAAVISVENSEETRWYERTCAPLSDRKRGSSSGWIYTIRDVTELHTVQQQVFQQQQQLAVTAEQQRVARDLHDNIGQILSFAGIQIQTVQRELEKGNTEKAQQYLAKLKEVTDQSYAQLRTYIFNLRQPSLQNVPFRKLLEEFAGNVQAVFHIDCALHLPPVLPVFFDSADVKSHLLSLTKEAVNNCIKHSGASLITIGMDIPVSGGFVYYIQDNGSGIAPHADTGAAHSSGIRIMEERALLTGGRMEVTSEYGKGTKIAVVYDGDKV